MGNWLPRDIGNWLPLEAFYRRETSFVSDQVIVKLQYSHRLGDVSESNLETLLTNLSKVNGTGV